MRRHIGWWAGAIAIVAVTMTAVPAGAMQEEGDILERAARLEVANVRLVTALTRLAATSGVPVAFSPDLVPARFVSCHCRDLTVGGALDTLLAGTGLRYRATRTQVLVVVARTRFLTGEVRNESDGAPVPRATIHALGGDRVATDGRGRFTLEVALDTVRLAVTRLGIVADTVSVAPGVRVVPIRVASAPIDLDPVLAEASGVVDLERFTTTAQTSTMTFDGATLARIPGLVEPDVIRAVQAMPGTVSRTDFSTGYNVRGGETDQNLVQLDGVTVINPVHLGGVFSTFDANTLGSVTFLTGGFPARYAGRLSSVLDLDVRSDFRRATGQGQVSLLTSKLMLGGPLGRGSYLVSARRTYADQVVRTFTPYELPYYFTDMLGKVSMPFGRSGASVAVTGYWGRDVLDIDTESTTDEGESIHFRMNWGNRLVGGTWTQPLDGGRGRATLTTRASVSEFSTALRLTPDLSRYQNDVRLLTAATALDVSLGRDNALGVGLSVEQARTAYEVEEVAFDPDANVQIAGLLPLFNREYRPTVFSAYADLEWNLGHRLLLRPGVRAEYTSGAGYLGLGPRMNAKLFVADRTALIASAGRYHQALHSLRDRDLPFTFYEFWIGAGRSVPVAQSDHLVLGGERWFDDSWQLLVEGYRKNYRNLIIPAQGLAFRSEGDEFLPMSGHSVGFDLIVRKHRGTVRGWLAYGFSRSERRADGDVFAPGHDRRHTFNLVLEAPGPLGADLGIHWVYGAGLPYTGFQGEWNHKRYLPGSHRFVRERREPITVGINDERFPSYSRLDMGLRWHFEKWGLDWTPYLQVANAYNRRNVFAYTYNFGSSPARRTSLSQLPFVPTFGVEFRW